MIVYEPVTTIVVYEPPVTTIVKVQTPPSIHSFLESSRFWNRIMCPAHFLAIINNALKTNGEPLAEGSKVNYRHTINTLRRNNIYVADRGAVWEFSKKKTIGVRLQYYNALEKCDPGDRRRISYVRSRREQLRQNEKNKKCQTVRSPTGSPGQT